MLNTIQQPDFLLSRLISCIGKDDASAAERADIERSLREIKATYQRKSEAFGGVEMQRRMLGKFLALKAELRKLRQQLKPIECEIHEAGWFRIHDPDGEASPLLDFEETKKVRIAFLDLMHPERIKKADETEDMSIRHYIERSADYRKRPLRKFLIEPFLIMLHCHGVVASPRELPLNHMTDALFNWVSIEKKRRPTDSGIRTIASYIERRLGEIDEEYDERIRLARAGVARRSKN